MKYYHYTDGFNSVTDMANAQGTYILYADYITELFFTDSMSGDDQGGRTYWISIGLVLL